MSFELILVDQNEALCEAWRKHFADLPNVTIVRGKFQAVSKYDCIVSPANSFGLMDGGVDAAIIRVFGKKLMHDVQTYIMREHLGEQPVGTSFVIETGHVEHRWLAHTPTMRVPMNISRTDNVYKAMWALLGAVHHHNKDSSQKINSVVCTGLGTGAGRVSPHEAARQMSLAYRNYLNPPTDINWKFANQRHHEVSSFNTSS